MAISLPYTETFTPLDVLTAEELNHLQANDTYLANNVLLAAYPVGSIYMSVSSTNPSTLFGGTWEQIEDKFLLAAGSTYDAGDTGGSATHNHMYGIRHGGYRTIVTGWGGTDQLALYNDGTWSTASTQLDGAQGEMNSTSQNQNVGRVQMEQTANTGSASTLPPYLAVYVFKRIA